MDYLNHVARYYVLAHPDDPVLSRIGRRHAVAAGLVFAALIVLRTACVAASWWDGRHDVADLRTAIARCSPARGCW